MMISNSDSVPLSPGNQRKRNARLTSIARSPELRDIIEAHCQPDETPARAVLRLLELTRPPRHESAGEV